MDLISLVKELERQKKNSLDLIVESSSLKAVTDEKSRVRLAIPEYGDFQLTEWAHGQLADKLGIPRRYYEKMREAGKGIMDNYDLVFLALDEFKRKETVEVYRADLTETMLYLKAVDGTLTASVRADDIVYGGLILRNSEVGASAFRVEPFILRKVCSNGLILEYSLKKVHLRRQTLEIGEIDWSDETRELEDKALWSKVRDIIRATFNREVFESWIERLKESTEVKVENPIKAVNNIVKIAGLSEERKQKLLMHFSEPTKYGLINAVTNLARETKNIDEQIRLEELGGKILASDTRFEAFILEGDESYGESRGENRTLLSYL